MSFSYVDLFAGCGGLSLGLEAEGGELVVAVERSPMAAETFYHNLVDPVASKTQWDSYVASSTEIQFTAGVIVKELSSLIRNKELMQKLATIAPDAVVGGPPCQGFSLAGRRNPDDARNSLPWQFLELVEKTKPKVVVIENVVGMRHKFSQDDDPVFDQLQIALQETEPGYVVQAVEVNALHYGAPQHRPRLMIIGLRADIARERGIKSSGSLWKSDFTDRLEEPLPDLAPRPTTSSANAPTVRQALAGLGKMPLQQNPTLNELSKDWGVLRHKSSTSPANNNIRAHNEKSVERFRVYQWLHSIGIDSRFLSHYTVADADRKLELLERVRRVAVFPAIAPDGHTIAPDFESLPAALDAVKTRKHSQRVLALDEPARTVVTIGDDYVHPIEPRTFTVRELARFQGFPDAFEFKAKETTGGLNRRNEVPQYSQVGNAVSPFLARAVGQLINEILS